MFDKFAVPRGTANFAHRASCFFSLALTGIAGRIQVMFHVESLYLLSVKSGYAKRGTKETDHENTAKQSVSLLRASV